MEFLSVDRKRKTLMMRQFHQERFVIVYAFNAALSKPNRLVFESESFENFDNAWKSRETYEGVSNDEFIEHSNSPSRANRTRSIAGLTFSARSDVTRRVMIPAP